MRSDSDFTVGVLVGGLVGVLVGLLLAPAPGEETRRVIGQRATDAGGRVRAGAVDLADRVRVGAVQVSGRASASAQDVGRAVRRQVQSLLHTAQESVEEAVDALNPDGSAGTGPEALQGSEG